MGDICHPNFVSQQLEKWSWIRQFVVHAGSTCQQSSFFHNTLLLVVSLFRMGICVFLNNQYFLKPHICWFDSFRLTHTKDNKEMLKETCKLPIPISYIPVEQGNQKPENITIWICPSSKWAILHASTDRLASVQNSYSVKASTSVPARPVLGKSWETCSKRSFVNFYIARAFIC